MKSQIIIKVLKSKDTSEMIFLDPKQEDTIIRGLRLLLLVGNDNDGIHAAKLLDLLLPKE